MLKDNNIFYKIFHLYYDGFRSMTWGWSLWAIIFLKLFIMFAVLRLFFFPNFLNGVGDSDEAKSEYVVNELIERSGE